MTTPSTTLIGRERSIAKAAAHLRREDVRLLTITGPGGIGKTRLANAVAAVLADEFADGLIAVPLQSVRDPILVVGTFARALGLFDGEGDLEQRVTAYLEGSRLLFVVDNFEQVVEAAPLLAEIVRAGPGLKMIVTSRTRLRVRGEQELPLDPLARADAVRMFVERARSVRPDFSPEGADVEAIASICDHLDCLPLAIELAASRAKVLSPTAMLARLEHPLDLLTSGSSDAPTRHRALRDTIDWSFELLDDGEKTLFRRLAVFSGGHTLAAAEEVCSGDLDTLGSIVDKSLVRADGDRFGMLETIREYAGELLATSQDATDVRRAHADYYLDVARAAAAARGTADQAQRQALLEAEHDNLRAALRFLLDGGDPAQALELASLLWRFWFERGYLSEGRLRLDESLEASVDASPIRVRALNGNGVLAHYQGDYDRAEALCQSALELATTLESERGIAEARVGLALVRRTRGDYPEAERLFQEAISTYEAVGDTAALGRTIDRLALSLVVSGEEPRARPLFERSLELARDEKDPHGIAMGLYGLAVTRETRADRAARAQTVESLDILRAVGDRRTFAKVLWNLADIDADLGDAEAAAAQFAESLTLFVEFGDRWFAALVLESAGFLAVEVGDVEQAASLLGTADATWAALRVPRLARNTARQEEALDEVRGRLGEARFSAAWEAGRHSTAAAAVELVASVAGRAASDAPDGLTARELEVLTLVAKGYTDAEVAERLVVSLRTVHAHLRSVYRKLDVHTRSAATRYAFEHGLAA